MDLVSSFSTISQLILENLNSNSHKYHFFQLKRDSFPITKIMIFQNWFFHLTCWSEIKFLIKNNTNKCIKCYIPHMSLLYFYANLLSFYFITCRKYVQVYYRVHIGVISQSQEWIYKFYEKKTQIIRTRFNIFKP